MYNELCVFDGSDIDDADHRSVADQANNSAKSQPGGHSFSWSLWSGPIHRYGCGYITHYTQGRVQALSRNIWAPTAPKHHPLSGGLAKFSDCHWI